MELDVTKLDDPRQQTLLYNEYKQLIYTTVYSIVKNTETAEDLTNDVFIKVFQDYSKYRIDTNFRNWIKTMSFNLAIDYIRKSAYKNTENTIDNDESHFQVSATDLDPESGVIRKEMLEVLQWYIKKLKPTHAIVLDLLYNQGKSYAQIAEQLNQKINTTKGTIRKAKLSLKKLMLNY